MKALDLLIAAALVGCMFLGYAGFRLYAALLMVVIVIVASWRFWDERRLRELIGQKRASGELNPELDQPYSPPSRGNDAAEGEHSD